jgi:hypothetical protein
VIAAIRRSFCSTGGSFELWPAASNKIIDAAGQLLANLNARLNTRSDRSASSSVKQPAILGSFIFYPSLLIIKVSISYNILRALNDIRLSSLSSGGGLIEIVQVA